MGVAVGRVEAEAAGLFPEVLDLEKEAGNFLHLLK